MGNENVIKDPNIQIFLQLKKLIYHSGDKVKGYIYVQAKQYSQYSDLVLRIDCFEGTQNDKKRDKNKDILKQERNTYFEELTVGEFLNGLYKGQHQFYFYFLLPQNLPGSLIVNKNNYIRYQITAYLQSTQPTITNQLHSRQIWILQKFRGLPQPILIRQIQESKCCIFGYSYGFVQIILQFQSNLIQPGQKAKIKLEINANRMSTSIKKTTIRLVEKNIIITKGEKQQIQVKELFAFDFNQKVLEKGRTLKMQKYVIFPNDLPPTAIGQILARYYVIETKLKINYFIELKEEHHFFVQSNKNQINEENKFFIKPQKWKHVKYKRKQFTKLKNYQYKKNKLIRFHNQFDEKADNFQRMKQIQLESSRQLKV